MPPYTIFFQSTMLSNKYEPPNSQKIYKQILFQFQKLGFSQTSQFKQSQLQETLNKICFDNAGIKVFDPDVVNILVMKADTTYLNGGVILILHKFISGTISILQAFNKRPKPNNPIDKKKQVTGDDYQKELKMVRLLVGTFKISDPSILPYIQPSKEITVKIETINSTKHMIPFDGDTTVLDVKKYIFDNLTTSLEVKHMSLTFIENKLRDNTKLAEIKIKPKDHLQLKQSKIDIDQIPNLVVDMDRVDQVNCVKGCAKMSCGHYFARQTIIEVIRYQIDQNKKYQITCPFVDCQRQWSFKECKMVCVFTKEQTDKLQTELRQNWNSKFTQACPYCKIAIFIEGPQDFFICQQCDCKFCRGCLKLLINQTVCSSQQCTAIYQYLANAPLTRIFKLKNKTTGKQQIIAAPDIRACPSCWDLIQNLKGDKATVCRNCDKRFCYVCLKVAEFRQRPCSPSYQVCKLAERQQWRQRRRLV